MKRIFKNQFILYLLSSICFLWMPVISSAKEPAEEILIDEEDEAWLEEETKDSSEDQKEASPSNSMNTSIKEDVPAKPDTETSESPEPSTAPEAPEMGETNKVEEDNDEKLEQEFDSPTTEESSFSTFVDPYEKDLHTLYKQYYHQKVSQAEWQRIVSQVSGDIYTVQADDTLWDISKMLFDDPNYWPKLWAVNAGIGNPHLIQPGYDLGFVHGTASQPPSIKLVDTNIVDTNIVGATVREQAKPIKTHVISLLKGKKIKVPAPVKHKYPVMHSLPNSLSQISLSRRAKDIIDMSRIKIRFGTLNASAKSFLGYFMSANPVDSMRKGIILRKKDNDGLWSHTTETVILQLDDFMHAGHLFTVVKDLGKLSSLPRGVRGPTGYQVEVQGEVKVIGRVPDSEDLYEAQVTKAVSPISNGSILIDSALPEFNFNRTDTFGSGSAQIIGFPSIVQAQQTGGPYDFVYLNRGSDSGFAEGQMYQVKANKDIRRHFPYGYDIQLGELKIVYTEERFATAIVTGLKHFIRIGDYVVSHQGVVTGGEPPSMLDEEDLIKEEVKVRPDEELKHTPENLPPDTVEMGDDKEEEDLNEVFERSTVETTKKPLSEMETEVDDTYIGYDEDPDEIVGEVTESEGTKKAEESVEAPEEEFEDDFFDEDDFE